jgi:hypothetical protein
MGCANPDGGGLGSFQFELSQVPANQQTTRYLLIPLGPTQPTLPAIYSARQRRDLCVATLLHRVEWFENDGVSGQSIVEMQPTLIIPSDVIEASGGLPALMISASSLRINTGVILQGEQTGHSYLERTDKRSRQ